MMLAAATMLAAGCGLGADPLAAATAAIPDLTERGYEEIDCAEGIVIGAVYQPVTDDRYTARCWRGTPGLPFFDEANFIRTAITNEHRGADITDRVCPADLFNEFAGIACRALQFGSDSDGVVLGVMVALTDAPGAAVGLGEQPTSQELYTALVDAEVEVLIGTDGIIPSS